MQRALTVGSLFSGVGGFDLGLERAGMRVIWQSEIDPYASAVLRRHWPEVPNFGDIRTITRKRVYAELYHPYGTDWTPDVICGGFPCQPFSSAARGRNTMDACLWPEMLRVVSELRPTWVCGENVVAIDGLALDQVVSDLETRGYETAPPLVIPAAAVGLDHQRERYWFIGHSNCDSESRVREHAEVARVPRTGNDSGGMGTPDGISRRMDRMRCLGNALVPGIAEVIGRAIIESAAA